MASGEPRFCNCVGYMFNKDGKCCMEQSPIPPYSFDDLVLRPGFSTTTSTFKLTPVETEAEEEPVADQGWQCPLCKTIYSPYVDRCSDCGNANALS